MEELAKKDVPSGLDWRIVDVDKLPTDRIFRDAWTDDFDTETVDVDISKSKQIKMKEIRLIRDEKLKELDIETLKGVDVQTQKQQLRDIPQNVVLPDDLNELADFMPNELL